MLIMSLDCLFERLVFIKSADSLTPGIFHSMKAIRPYFIAELSANHMQDLDVARELVTAAHASGATAIKLQTFTADGITVKSNSVKHSIPQESSLWSGIDLWALMKEAETPWEWHKDLIDYAHSLGMDAFSTPYSPDALHFLLNLGVDAVKLSSFDVINLPLLHEVAKVHVPVIQSTGMASLAELDEAVTILGAGASRLILLKCTSEYPCSFDNANLLGIKTLRERYGVEIGFSDHTLGDVAAVAAIGLGATVFEKHLKLNLDDSGLDSAFSLSAKQFEAFVLRVNAGYVSLGSPEIKKIEAEQASFWERPSIVALKDIYEDEILDETCIGVRRPNIGMSPAKLHQILGLRSKGAITKGQGITSDLVAWNS